MDQKEFYDPYASRRKKNQKPTFGFDQIIGDKKEKTKTSKNIKELHMQYLLKFFQENNRFARIKSRVQNTIQLEELLAQNYKKIFGIKHLVSRSSQLQQKNFLSTALLGSILTNFETIREHFDSREIIFNTKAKRPLKTLEKLFASLREFAELLIINFRADFDNRFQPEKKSFFEFLHSNSQSVWGLLHKFILDVLPFFSRFARHAKLSVGSLIQSSLMLDRSILRLTTLFIDASHLRVEHAHRANVELVYLNEHGSNFFILISAMMGVSKNLATSLRKHGVLLAGLLQKHPLGYDAKHFEIDLIRRAVHYLSVAVELCHARRMFRNFRVSLSVFKDNFEKHYFFDMLHRNKFAFELHEFISAHNDPQTRSMLASFFEFSLNFDFGAQQDSAHKPAPLEPARPSSSKKPGFFKSLYSMFRGRSSPTRESADSLPGNEPRPLDFGSELTTTKLDFNARKNCVFNLISVYFWLMDRSVFPEKRLRGLIPKLGAIFDFLRKRIGPKIYFAAYMGQVGHPFVYSVPNILKKISSPDFIISSMLTDFSENCPRDYLSCHLLLSKYYFDSLNKVTSDSINFANQVSLDAQFKRVFFAKFSRILQTPKDFLKLESSMHLQFFLVLFESVVSTVEFLESSYDFLRSNGVCDSVLVSLFSCLLSFIIKVKDKHYFKNGALSSSNPVQVGFASFQRFVCKTAARVMETIYYMQSKDGPVRLISDVDGAFEASIQQNISDLSFESISQEFIMDFYFLFSFQNRFLYMTRCLGSRNNGQLFNSMPQMREIRRTHIVEDGLQLFREMKGERDQRT